MESKDECRYDVHKFKYSSHYLVRKGFPFPHFVMVLLLNKKLFLATVFGFLHVITALGFNTVLRKDELIFDFKCMSNSMTMT